SALLGLLEISGISSSSLSNKAAPSSSAPSLLLNTFRAYFPCSKAANSSIFVGSGSVSYCSDECESSSASSLPFSSCVSSSSGVITVPCSMSASSSCSSVSSEQPVNRIIPKTPNTTIFLNKITLLGSQTPNILTYHFFYFFDNLCDYFSNAAFLVTNSR